MLLSTEEMKEIKDFLLDYAMWHYGEISKIKKDAAKLRKKGFRELADIQESMAVPLDERLVRIEQLVAKLDEILSKECDE